MWTTDIIMFLAPFTIVISKLTILDLFTTLNINLATAFCYEISISKPSMVCYLIGASALMHFCLHGSADVAYSCYPFSGNCHL